MNLEELQARHEKYKNKNQAELLAARMESLSAIQNNLRKRWLPDQYIPADDKTKEEDASSSVHVKNDKPS